MNRTSIERLAASRGYAFIGKIQGVLRLRKLDQSMTLPFASENQLVLWLQSAPTPDSDPLRPNSVSLQGKSPQEREEIVLKMMKGE